MPDLGLTPGQLENAKTIIAVGKRRGMSTKDIQTALAVALAESSLLNYANTSVPDSMRIPHDAVGSDHDSVGIFQQRVMYWGTPAQLMNVEYAAGKFYDELAKVKTRDAMTIPQAAQTVQKSKFSDGSNYAKQTTLAEQITAAVTGNETYTEGSKTSVDPIKWIMDGGNLQRIGLFALGAAILLIAGARLLKATPTIKAVQAVAKVVK